MKIFNQLTIIILSFNRQKFIRRQFNYFADSKFNIVIVDQSNEPIEISKLNLNKNIKYFFLKESFNSRLCFAVDQIKTPYAIFLPDDEFLIESCLISCIKFLNTNKDYSSCAGRSLAFSIEDSKIIGHKIYENLRDYDINYDDSIERVMMQSSPYKFQPIHSVSNVQIWKHTALILSKLNPTPDMFELLFGFISAYYGKLKVIPELMNLRSLENEPINTINWNQNYRFPKWIIDSNHINVHVDFFNNLNSSAYKLLKQPNNFSIAISTGFLLYTLKQSKKNLTLHNKVVYVINILLPRSLVNYFKKLLRIFVNIFFREKIISQPLIKKCKELENENIKIDNNSITKIIFEITKSYN